MSQQIIKKMMCSSLALWLLILFIYPVFILGWSHKAFALKATDIFFTEAPENYLLLN
jgi:K+-transporting ATPase c subunit